MDSITPLSEEEEETKLTSHELVCTALVGFLIYYIKCYADYIYTGKIECDEKLVHESCALALSYIKKHKPLSNNNANDINNDIEIHIEI